MGDPHVSGEAARAFELVLVGGGLQAGLVVLGVLAYRPDARLAIVEADPALGGNHTWSVSPGDLPASARAWIEPLVVHAWPRYDVMFPGLRRTLDVPYCTITSERFARVVSESVARSSALAAYLGRRAVHLDEHEVALNDGTTLRAELVIDARGPDLEAPTGCGFQKFLGLELEVDQPHGCTRPIIMDATVAQHGGFRFFYVLPLEPRRLLVEDTCFSRSAHLDRSAARAAVLDYAGRFGRVTRVLRQELGVLPMPWEGDLDAPVRSPLVAGYRGGWFHPATGYSLPVAARLACFIAERPPREVLGRSLMRLHQSHRAQVRYAHWLNRLLFHCFAPQDMRNVFERFYALPAEVIHRFLACSTTWRDRARIIAGLPPRGFSLRGAFAPVADT